MGNRIGPTVRRREHEDHVLTVDIAEGTHALAKGVEKVGDTRIEQADARPRPDPCLAMCIGGTEQECSNDLPPPCMSGKEHSEG